MITAKQGSESSCSTAQDHPRMPHPAHVSVSQCFKTPGATSMGCSFLFVQEGNNEANMIHFLLPWSKAL